MKIYIDIYWCRQLVRLGTMAAIIGFISACGGKLTDKLKSFTVVFFQQNNVFRSDWNLLHVFGAKCRFEELLWIAIRFDVLLHRWPRY